MAGKTAKNSLSNVTFSAKYTFLIDTIGNTWSSNCREILLAFSGFFGVCVCVERIGQPSLLIFFLQ